MTDLPALARALLRLTDPRVREFITGDLEESFAAIAATEGIASARRWSYRQALAAALQQPWKPRRSTPVEGDGIMRTFLQDLLFGARMIRRQPAFSLVVVMTLALAIGANTVIFSFANILMLRPLPLKDTNTLGWIFAVDPHLGGNRGPLSIPEFMDYRKALTSFEALGASSRTSVTLTGRGDAKRLTASRVTANLTDMWGLRLQAGRGFSSGANAPGAPAEVLISHHYWDRDLNRDPSIVGQSLTIDGHPSTVMGVLDAAIEIGNLSEIDVWTPVTLAADAPREERILRVNGRLKPGVTLAQAEAEVRQFAQTLAREHPKTNEGWSARVAPTREAMTGTDTWVIMTLLSLVVGFVLLLACANLANLVLSRATGRRRELAVRSALGASRTRVVRQMLTENLVYGICGGAAGLVVAYAGLAAMRAAAYEPFFAMVQIDRNVLGFTAALALLTPMLFAILPALHSTRADAGEALKDGGTRTAGGVRAARSRSVLIVAQLGLAVMLLVLATLLVQALVNISDAPLGLDSARLLTAKIDLPAWRYTSAPAMTTYDDQLLARLKANPGIENAALTDRLPFLDGEPISEITIDGRPAVRAEDRPWAVASTVSDEFFPTTGIAVMAGRAFGREDQPGRAPAAVVNREMARRFWGTPEQAVGARLTLAGQPLQIVGVVSDVLRADREGINPQIYVSSRQRPAGTMALIVRAADPHGIATAVRSQIRGIDADVPVYEMRAFQQALDEDLSSSRILGSMFVSFAILALVLAASGLYAVVSYAASQRVKEFGVRVALGAMPSDITRMMLWQTGRLVAIGLALGLIGGRALAMGATTLLYKVSPSDPLTYAGVAVTLGTVALLASYVPVRRATSIDPVRALRLE
jgi:putative ABC transport system permease protein